MMPDFGTVVLLSTFFKKPIEYFLHPKYRKLYDQNTTPLEDELLLLFRQLDNLSQEIVLKQVQALIQVHSKNNE